MLIDQVRNLLPNDWYPMDINNRRYEIFELQTFSQEYQDVASKVLADHYYDYIFGIYKLQNVHLYGKYLLKKREYEQRGHYDVLQLYHDTSCVNIESIASYNIDWRYGERFMFGPGVYFSVTPKQANKHSARGDPRRAMFVCDVLVQNVQRVLGTVFLPDFNYDTVLAHNDSTIVKYFDCEYYPQYFLSYYSNRC